MTPILFTYKKKRFLYAILRTHLSFCYCSKHKQGACKEMINYFCCFFRRQCEKSQDWQRFPTLCRSLNIVVAWRFICCRFWALFTYVSGPHRRQLQVVALHCGSALTYWRKMKRFSSLASLWVLSAVVW